MSKDMGAFFFLEQTLAGDIQMLSRSFFSLLALTCVLAFAPMTGAVAEDGAAAATKPYKFDKEKGTVDWYTFNGYRRYHSECHVCHGPAGLGSSYAPALVESISKIGYEGFLNIVVNGRVSETEAQLMPGFADNLNVMCFIDDLYAYLAARADGVLGRERPKHGGKPPEAKERDKSCLGF